MERNENFPYEELSDISIRLAWGQLEMYADDIEQIQVIASGDDHTLGELRIAVKDNELQIEQPQYGISLDITRGHWMQLCVRVPKAWSKAVRAGTISGFISARGLGGSRVELETITGDLKASGITASEISLRTTAGTIHGDGLIADRLASRSVSGDISLDDVSAKICRLTSVSGDMSIKLQTGFEQMDLRTVSGDMTILTELEEMQISLRTVSGHKTVNGVTLTQREDAPIVRATGVSGNLKIIGLRG